MDGWLLLVGPYWSFDGSNRSGDCGQGDCPDHHDFDHLFLKFLLLKVRSQKDRKVDEFGFVQAIGGPRGGEHSNQKRGGPRSFLIGR